MRSSLPYLGSEQSNNLTSLQGIIRTMNNLPRFLSGLVRSNAIWTCASCAKSSRRLHPTTFFNPSRYMKRKLSISLKRREDALPTMVQLQNSSQKRNSSTLYYTLSIILGTVAFSYGSVPMYKMVLSSNTSFRSDRG